MATPAADRYDEPHDPMNPDGACHEAVGLPAGTCEPARQEASDARNEDGDR